jgi:flagellar basal-body rod modification protein FlgD
MPTDPISSAYTPPAYQQSSTPNASLDKDGFLKMLTAQLQNQDPSSQQDPNQYFQTISSMTLVEQMTNMAKQTAITGAQAMIGKSVTYTDQTTLQPVTGTVDSMTILNGEPRISVDGVGNIDPSAVTKVQ